MKKECKLNLNEKLVCLHITTAGKQSDDLGTDETPVILLTVAVYDIQSNKSTLPEQFVVKINPDLPSCTRFEQDQLFSEECIQETGLDPIIMENGRNIDEIMNKVHFYLQEASGSSSNFQLITEGQSALRLALHPQLARENIDLTQYEYLYQFIDLKKQYQNFYKRDKMISLDEMTIESRIYVNNQMGNFGHLQCQKMIEIVQKLNNEGNNWENVETISKYYISAIVRKTDYVNDEVVVRARGLPWQATDSDISRFFRGLNIEKGGIALVLSKVGRRNGEALIRFENKDHRDMALRKHKHHMGQRYIEVYMATGRDFIQIAGGETKEAEDFLLKLQKPTQTLIRMRGLPYTATTTQIVEFFASSNCKIDGDDEGILFVNHCDGRATGDAFVIFSSEAEAEEALKSHRENIGTRYIELFKSTPAEVNQVMNSVLNPQVPSPPPISHSGPMQPGMALNGALTLLAGTPGSPQFGGVGGNASMGLHAPVHPPPFLIDDALSLLATGVIPIPMPTSANMGSHNPHQNPAGQATNNQQLLSGIPTYLDPNTSHLRLYLRIKGMPLDASVADIIHFLESFSNYISYQGVHIVFNGLGQPAGEAIIQMISEHATMGTVDAKNHQMFTSCLSGKKSQVELTSLNGYDLTHFNGFIQQNGQQNGMGMLPGSHMSPQLAAGNANSMTAQLQNLCHLHMIQKQLINNQIPTSSSSTNNPGFPFNPLTTYPTAACFPYLGASQSSMIIPPHLLTGGAAPIVQSGPFINNLFCNLTPTSHMPTSSSASSPIVATESLLSQADQNNNNMAVSISTAKSTDLNNNNNSNKASFPTAISYIPGLIPLPATGISATSGIGEYTTVVLKNLPKDVSGEEILSVLAPILRQGIVIGDVRIGMSPENQPTGEAFVSFFTRNDAEKSINDCANQFVRNNLVELSVY